MNKIWTIVGKELKRVFTDYRVIFSLFILPPLMIVLIYGLMGLGAKKQFTNEQQYVPTVIVAGAPQALGDVPSFKSYLELLEANNVVELTYFDQLTTEEIKNYQYQILTQELDMLVVFPEDFISKVTENQKASVEVHQNINNQYYDKTKNIFNVYLSQYEQSLLLERSNLPSLDIFEPKGIDLGDQEKRQGTMLAMILPFMLVIFLMSTAMGVGIETVSGEKERGTIATLLVTPIKRSHLAVGKIISVSILGFLSSITSFLGIVVILPVYAKMMGAELSGEQVTGFFGGYTLLHILMLFLIIVISVLFFVAIVMLVSTLAKSVKESNALIMPIYIAVMGVAMFTLFSTEVSKEFTTYMIPIYNIIAGLKAVIAFEMVATNFMVLILSTLVYTLGIIFLIQKLFRNEKVMFNQ